MKKKNLLFISLGILGVASIYSCRKDNLEEMVLQKIADTTTTKTPTPNACDTADVKYATISTIMASNCNNCHSTSNPSSGIITDTYNDTKASFDIILKSIEHAPNTSPMPQGGDKLDTCSINKLRAWRNQGFKN